MTMNRKERLVPLFKDFDAKFLKRAEGDTHFTCNDGDKVRAAVDEAIATGERVNIPLKIVATVPSCAHLRDVHVCCETDVQRSWLHRPRRYHEPDAQPQARAVIADLPTVCRVQQTRSVRAATARVRAACQMRAESLMTDDTVASDDSARAAVPTHAAIDGADDDEHGGDAAGLAD
jgi:hypothetical protein